MKVSIVVPTYNGQDLLADCIPSLLSQRYGDPFEITVVDDGSSEDIVAFLADRFPEVRAIRCDSNRGFAAAVNEGLRSSEAEFVALVNNDTRLDSDWLARAVEPFAEQSVASVATRVVSMDDRRVDTAGDLYTVVGGALKNLHGRPESDVPAQPIEVFSASAAAAIYRRSCLLEIGGWDEDLEAYYDDVDVGLRLRLRGYRCVLAPSAVCLHRVSASYEPAGYRYHFNSSRNSEILFWAGMPRAVLARRLVPHLFFLLLQAGHKLLQGQIRPYLSGKIWVLMRPARVASMRRRRQSLLRGSAHRVQEALTRDWLSAYFRWRYGVR
jgi:hypothetical protein